MVEFSRNLLYYSSMLIIFEGGEFVGKTTQIKILAECLRKAGIEVVITKEPRGDIRKELLFGSPAPEEELDLFLKDRTLHFIEVVLPAMKAGKWVLVDRCSPSTIAYQHYGRGLDLEDIKKRDKTTRQGTDFDLVILLDMDPELAMKRVGTETRFEKESLEFHQRLRKGYLAQAKWDPEHWLVLDANLPVQEIGDKIWQEIKKRLY